MEEGNSRPLVEDGCRSVIREGGPEVDLQGTVTVGRGGVRQGTLIVSLNIGQDSQRHMANYVTTPKEICLPKASYSKLSKKVEHCEFLASI